MKKFQFKGFIAGLLTASILMFSFGGYAESITKIVEVAFNSINIQVNGLKISADNILYNNTTYVPLRAIAEMLGKDVGWDGDTNTANIKDKMQIPSATPIPIPTNKPTSTPSESIIKTNSKLFVDGKEVTLDTSLVKYNDRFLVPIRAITEALGAVVNWDEQKKQITIEDDKTKLEMVIDNNKAYVNSKEVVMDAYPTIYQSRTLIPLSMVVETFGSSMKITSSDDDKIINESDNINNCIIEIITPKKDLIEQTIGYLELNKEYIAKDGLTVLLKNIKKEDDIGSVRYTISYTLKNNTTDKKIDEGTFKIFFEDGKSENQYGFFGTLFPAKSIDKTYTFEMLKTQKPITLEYGGGFFSKTPEKDTLKWKIE